MTARCSAAAAAAIVLTLAGAAPAQEAPRYKQTLSGRPYSHHIELKDVAGRVIDPTAENAPPYSPEQTCKTCHDVDAIGHGLHFSRGGVDDAGRPGEPFWLVDARTGTALPVSTRGWPGTWQPDDLGMDESDVQVQFGSHMPAAAMDCMACHSAGLEYSMERWADELAKKNAAGAPTAALGLGRVNAARDNEGATASYDLDRFDVDGHVFFDIVRTPTNRACLACHTALPIDPESAVLGSDRWLHDDDVHLRAGMSCVDCHRNGIGHHTVRGYEGERHPTGADVTSLSCRGCHMEAGRLGAPLPTHAGLPPVHLEVLSCTACHSGPYEPDGNGVTGSVQTALAHRLGLPDQRRTAGDVPRLQQPVLRRDPDGVIRPKREGWATFWGVLDGNVVRPLPPSEIATLLRRALRVRRSLVGEFGAEREQALAKIAAGLDGLAGSMDRGSEAVPVFVDGGEVWRRPADGATPDGAAALEVVSGVSTPLSYAWDLAHPVRPARQSLGARGCAECHAENSPFMHGSSTVAGVMPLAEPRTVTALESMELDAALMAGWEQAFQGRDLFKWLGFATLGLVVLLVLLHLMVGLQSVVRWLGYGRAAASHRRGPQA